MAGEADDVIDHVGENYVKGGNKCAQKNHCNENHHCGAPKFTIFFKTCDFRIALPRPGRFFKFAFNSGDELRNSTKHAIWGILIFEEKWQGRGDSNSQLAVLETAALPIELLPC